MRLFFSTTSPCAGVARVALAEKGAEPEWATSRAGVAMGAIDAAAAITIGRRIDPAFDESPVGLRRRRSVIAALQRLQAEPPVRGEHDAVADLGVITAVVLPDQIRFRFRLRFAQAPWVPAAPRLDALAARAHQRPSFAATLPREMPKA